MPRGSSPPSSDDDGASAQLPSSESCEVSGLCKAQVLSEFGAGVFVRVFLVSKRSRLAEAVVFCGGGLSWVVVAGHLCAASVSALAAGGLRCFAGTSHWAAPAEPTSCCCSVVAPPIFYLPHGEARACRECGVGELETVASLHPCHNTQVRAQGLYGLEFQRQPIGQGRQRAKVCNSPSRTQKPWCQVQ